MQTMIWPRIIAFTTRKLLHRLANVSTTFLFRRPLVYKGTVASLSASLFTKSSSLKKQADAEILQKIQEADSYYNHYMVDNAYSILRRFRNSNDPELLWRLARVICEQGKLCKNSEEKKRLFEEALEIAERALKNADESGCFGAHKWYAIILNYASECQGTKAQLTKSYDVKFHLERALELDAKDPTTSMILGMWHFAFADIPSYTRLLARAIYATPPSSTFEEALYYFQRAELLEPGFCSTNNFYIGQIYEKLGKKDEAILEYKKAFNASIITADDSKIHEQAFKKLKSLGVNPKEFVSLPTKSII